MKTQSMIGNCAALGALALVSILPLAGCHSSDTERAGQMTSFSDGGTPAKPQLFTIPDDQMQHIQLVTIEPATIKNTLRLTGAVAYNAFKTTPVIRRWADRSARSWWFRVSM